MSILDQLDWTRVREHYDERVDVHRHLLRLHGDGKMQALAELLLGVTNGVANYSAAEHALGPRILSENADAVRRIYELADRFQQLTAARTVPKLVRDAQLSYLGIGVGSEASCMMNPETCWVANTRTIWTHLVIKHADDMDKASEELKLYRSADPSSKMAYAMWTEIHRLLETSMTRISKEGSVSSRSAGVAPGDKRYLWADAIANQLYAEHR